MATVYRLLDAGRQFFDDNGDPLSGGLLFTYIAGSSTKKTTYQESTGSTAHANPIVLDAAGRLPAPVWGTTGAYKLVLAPSTDTDPPAAPEWTEDDVFGINDTASTSIDQWINSGLTPTYTSATTFTLAGDQTTEFHIGRRLKSTNSGGTVYSTIVSVGFTSNTTTVATLNDSGSLDSGMSAVYYGVISFSNTAAAKGLAVIQHQSVSASVSVMDFLTGINSIFDHYIIVLKGFRPATDDVQLYARVFIAGPTVQSADGNYSWSGNYRSQGGTDTGNGSADGGPTTALGINVATASTAKVGNGASEGIDAIIEFWSPTGTAQRKRFMWRAVYTAAAGTEVSAEGGGAYGATTAIVGVRLSFSSGNIEAGSATLYGVRK